VAIFRELFYETYITKVTKKWPITHFHCPPIEGDQYSAASRHKIIILLGRGQLKCDGTRAETRFRLSAKRTSPFKSAGTSVQSITGSRGMRISGNNDGYTMFRSSVKGTGYPLHSPVSPSLPPPVRHRVPSHFNWTLRNKLTAISHA